MHTIFPHICTYSYFIPPHPKPFGDYMEDGLKIRMGSTFLYSCRVELLYWSWIISTESNSTPFICGAVINRGKMQAVAKEKKKCKLFRTKAPHKLASPFLKLYHYYILKMLICWADFPGELSKLVLFPRLPLCKGTAATSTSDLLITIRLPSLGSFKHW